MIRITRKWAYANGGRPYRIFIDGVYYDEIRVNETKEFEVEDGPHTVYAKIDWYRSNELCVDVNDSIMTLEVGTPMTGWKLFAGPLYATFWAHKYLWLREKEIVDAPPEDVTD